MIEGKFINKKIVAWVAFASYSGGGSIPDKIKGVLTDCDDDFILLDNSVCISKKYIIKMELAK